MVKAVGERRRGTPRDRDFVSDSDKGIPMAVDDIGSSESAETSSSPQKKLVILNAFGLPVGDHSVKLATRCGELVRTHVPVSIKDWRAVPKSIKEELWKLLQDEFIVPQSYKDKCLKNMSDMFRKYKAKLRMLYLDPHITNDDRLDNRPPGVKQKDWQAFIEHNLDPKIVDKRKKNAEVRKKRLTHHTSGRHGHARLEEKMKRQKKDDELPLTRTEVWIQAHTRKDGSVPSSVSSHMERVKELLSNKGEVNSHDILNDPLTQVFGIDTRGRVRGVGNVCRTQVIGASAAIEKLAQNDRKITDQSTSIKNLESQLKYVMKEIGGLKQLIEQRESPRSQTSTSIPSKMSQMIADSNLRRNDQPSTTWRNCKLLSWRKEVVACGRAYVGDEPQLIHCKPLPNDAYKIIVDIIEKGDVELPEPDECHSTLGEVGSGSIVAWPKSFTKFID